MIASRLGLGAAIAGAALVAAPAPAGAAVRLGAGEHGDYSRIVVNLAPPAGWRARAIVGGVELILPGVPADFDTSAVNDMRRAHRVRGTRVLDQGSDAVLRFDFNCRCRAEVISNAGDLLILDVRDGAGDYDVGAVIAADRTAAPTPPATIPSASAADADAGAPAPVDDGRATLEAEVARARLLLLEQLQRAADEGFVTFQDGQEPDGVVAAETIADASADPLADAAPLTEAAQDAAQLDAAQQDETPLAADAAPEQDLAAAADADDGAAIEAVAAETAAPDQPAPAPAPPPMPALSGSPDAAALSAEGERLANALLSAALAAEDGPIVVEPRAAPEAAADGVGVDVSDELDGPTADAKTPDTETADAAPRASEADESAPADRLDAAGRAWRAAALDALRAQPIDADGADAAAEPDADAVDTLEMTLATADECVDDALLDPGAWWDDRSFSEGLAARRATLYDALNRIDPGAVAALQQFYLLHGLGEEARGAPVAYKVSTATTRLLSAVADVLIGDAPAPDSPFRVGAPCGGRHALWRAAALADADPAASSAAYSRSARALARTPEPLRRLLGGRIALAAARAGDRDAAEDVMLLLLRTQKAPTPSMILARAELALAAGRAVAAREDLWALVLDRAPESPEAAIRLADVLVEPIDAAAALRLTDRMAGFAFQHRGSELGARLAESEARLLFTHGRVREAIEALDGPLAYGGATAERLRAARRALLADVVARIEGGAEPQLLVTAIDAVQTLGADAGADALRFALALHLLETGAPRLAVLVIDEDVAARSAEGSALRARALQESDLLSKVGELPEVLTADAPPSGGAFTSANRRSAEARIEAALENFNAGEPVPGGSDSATPGGAPGLLGPTGDLSQALGPLEVGGGGDDAPMDLTDGQRLLKSLETEIDLFKEIAEDG